MTKIDKNTSYFSPLCLCTKWKVHCLWKARACLLGLSMYFAVAGKEDEEIGAFFLGLFLAVLCHRGSKVKIVQNWCKRYILAKKGQLLCNNSRIVEGRALPRMQNMKRGQHSMHNNVGEDGQSEICSRRRWPV